MDGHALHISNGIVDAPVSTAFAVLAVAVLALCVLRGRLDLDDRLAPMAGMVAAFIFAAQMLNFGVLPGVSGHLIGGALAALLVGPYVGTLCVALVLVVQALFFADGGVTALGLNITNMAIIGTFLSYGVIALLLRVWPGDRSAGRRFAPLLVTGFVAALVSVVAASQGFVLQYALGGTTDIPIGGVAAAMAGVHVLIGIGEGLITAVTVLTVARVRPDLVYALRARRRAADAPQAPTQQVEAPAGGAA